MNYFILSLLCLLTGFSQAQEELTINLPKKIGSLQFIERKDYEKKEYGYGLRYQNDALLKVDIFIYNNGIKKLPSGVDSPEVKKEFGTIPSAFKQLEAMGKFKGVKKMALGKKSFNDLGVSFLWSRYSYSQVSPDKEVYGGVRISDSYMTIHKGNFVKIRMTTKKSDSVKDQKEIDAFIHQVAKSISEAEKEGGPNPQIDPSKDPKLIERAIRAFLDDPSSDKAEVLSSLFVTFATESEDVIIKIDTAMIPWMKLENPPENSDRLLSAFIGGNLLRQLETKVYKDSPAAGVEAVIKVYKALREKKKIENIKELDKWSTMKIEDIMKSLDEE